MIWRWRARRLLSTLPLLLASGCAPEGEQAGSQTNWLVLDITLDTERRYETLVGFGASLAYAAEEVAARTDDAALYDTMFADSGFDVIRMDNRYVAGADTDLAPTIEILSAARERFEQEPLFVMTSGSPPASLKANGSTTCSGDFETCTLVTLDDGGFDYAGFAEHWRASIEAYAAAGALPDWMSIQNNPNWIPPSANNNYACYFLPQEGTETLVIDGVETSVRYPGYRQAVTEITAALGTLPAVPRLLGPEVTEASSIQAYAAELDTGPAEAVAFHLYQTDPAEPDLDALTALRDLARARELPVFQTEMRAEGLETAILVHHAVNAAGAVMYLQNDFVLSASSLDDDTSALIALQETGFELQGPYHALRHYAVHTAPGWVRVDAVPSDERLLTSAWLSPEEDALTFVLVNPSPEDIRVTLPLTETREILPESEVIRTIFDPADADTAEASASLGELRADNVVELPAGSVVTLALWE